MGGAILVYLESLGDLTGTCLVSVPDVIGLPLMRFTASMEASYQTRRPPR